MTAEPVPAAVGSAAFQAGTLRTPNMVVVYSGTPAANNLVASAGNGGTDEFGNQILGGLVFYAGGDGGGYAVQVTEGQGWGAVTPYLNSNVQQGTWTAQRALAGPGSPSGWFCYRNGAAQALATSGSGTFMQPFTCQAGVAYRLRGRFLLTQTAAGSNAPPIITLVYGNVSGAFGSGQLFWTEYNTSTGAAVPHTTGSNVTAVNGAPAFNLSASGGTARVVELEGTMINNNSTSPPGYTVQPAGIAQSGQGWTLAAGSFFEMMTITPPGSQVITGLAAESD